MEWLSKVPALFLLLPLFPSAAQEPALFEQANTLKLESRNNQAQSLSFDPAGARLAVVHGGAMTIMDPETGRVIHHLESIGSWTRATFSGDGSYVATGSGLWDSKSGVAVRTADANSRQGPGAAFSPDGRFLVSARFKPSVEMQSVSDGSVFRTFTSNTFVYKSQLANCASFSPGGRWLAVGFNNTRRDDAPGEVKIWDVQTGREVRSFSGIPNGVWSVAFSPDGQLLAAAMGNYYGRPPSTGEVHVWDLTVGKRLFRFKGHTSCSWSTAFSPDGTLLVSAGGWRARSVPGEIKVWDVTTGTGIQTIPSEDGVVFAVEFHPDGKRFAACGKGGSVKMYRMRGTLPARRQHLSEERAEALWKNMGSGDVALGHRAFLELSTDPKTATALFARHLRKPNPDAKDRVEQLALRLDAPDPEVRDRTDRELVRMGIPARPALTALRKQAASPEVRNRVAEILERLEDPDRAGPENWRTLRAIALLGRLNTAEARRVLQGVVNGPYTSVEVHRARTALDRLGHDARR